MQKVLNHSCTVLPNGMRSKVLISAVLAAQDQRVTLQHCHVTSRPLNTSVLEGCADF